MNNFISKVKNFLLDLKDVSGIILGVLASIFAALFFFERKKNQVEKELTKNAETIQKVDNINTQIATVEEQTKEKENAPVTKEDLLNFLNDSNKPK